MSEIHTTTISNSIETQTDTPAKKETPWTRYRKRNLQKYNQYSIAYYYREKAKLPQELQDRKVGRPKKEKVIKEKKSVGRPRTKVENKKEIIADNILNHTCACGIVYIIKYKSRHDNSKKHKEFVAAQKVIEQSIVSNEVSQ